jgi:glycosyltransferase involved in cell wall biosynthesis
MAQEIAACDIVIAPLQTARGIQNKVLEGMAMAKPVIASPQANEGINAHHGQEIHIADEPQSYVDAIVGLAADPTKMDLMGVKARQFVQQSFSWEASFDMLDQIIENVLPPSEKQDVPQ